MVLILTGGLFVLAVISGILGLGVAFTAVPFPSFFLPDLVHQVQPLSLLLNGITALFAVFGVAQSGLMGWRKAILLVVITTIPALPGSWLLRLVAQIWVWTVYFVTAAHLAWRRRCRSPCQPDSWISALAFC